MAVSHHNATPLTGNNSVHHVRRRNPRSRASHRAAAAAAARKLSHSLRWLNSYEQALRSSPKAQRSGPGVFTTALRLSLVGFVAIP